MNEIVKEIILNLHYLPTKKDHDGKIVSSGIGSIDIDTLEKGLRLGISEDLIFDWESDKFVDSGKQQINMTGTKKSYFELGKLLIALSVHPDEDDAYHVHLDNVEDKDGIMMSHIIIHAPQE